MIHPVPRSFDDVATLGDLSRFNAAQHPQREALLFQGRSTSYRQFEMLTNRVANGLLREGLRPGARVAFMDKNSDLFFEIVFGCAKSGTVLVGVNWRLTPQEVTYILNDSRAEILFVGPDFWDVVEAIRGSVPSLKRIVAMGRGHPEWPNFEDWRESFADDVPQVPVTSDDVAIQMYTSGTTGHPKGVQLAHRNFFAFRRFKLAADMAFDEWTEHDVSLVAMPCFHIGGVGWGIIGLRAAARNIVIREFDPGVVLDMIQRHAIGKLFLVPTAMRMVLQQPKARTTSYASLKYILYAASPIPLDLLREAIDVFRCRFVQLYGMTETTGGATYLPPDDHDVNGNERMRSAGKPFPGVSLKVVDAEGKEVAVRALGEICIRSPANMVGYWNRPEDTAATLIDGYVHSGDVGYLDEDGYVYLRDRAKDMIISGAENICPADIEEVLFDHPAVADVAVIGVPDTQWGEAVKAIVVTKNGQHVSADEIIGYARGRIASYKLPKSVDFVSALPRNAAGKILKGELRKPYWAGMDRNID
jgi:acyl-CoA synthetase (AMP-forming)/AMP-acid ligase II